MTVKLNFLICFSIVNLLIFFTTIQSYSGSYLIYFLFSLVFFSLVLFNLIKSFSYSYFFLSILLWLGFYLKVVSHLLYSFPYLEPIGEFVATGSSWDEVLLLASISALGVMAARGSFFFYHQKKISTISSTTQTPITYKYLRKYLLISLIFLILFICFINSYFGFHQIGMAPRIVFTYPANAFIAYMLNFGLITIVSIYLWWDIHGVGKFLFVFAIVLLEGLCVSMSIVSRGIFIFHLLPILLVLFRMRLINLNLKTSVLLIFFAAIFLSTSYLVVDVSRGYLYREHDVDFRSDSKNIIKQLSHKTQERDDIVSQGITSTDKLVNIRLRKLDDEILSLEVQISKNQSEITTSSTTIGGKMGLIASELRGQLPAAFSRAVMLLTNRWVGLEGAMSVQSIPNKNWDLFFQGLTESYQPSIVPLYQHLSKSIYTGMDPNQWKFGSLPGATAFLFYSGSFLFVFLGMFALACFAFYFEYIVLFLTGNLFLVSLYSCFLANIITQLGDVPRQNVITITMLVLTGVIICLLQRFILYKRA